jgi:hypothetical protein
MKICVICNEKAANWKRKKGKKREHLPSHICDPCLSAMDSPDKVIDEYDFIEVKKK